MGSDRTGRDGPGERTGECTDRTWWLCGNRRGRWRRERRETFWRERIVCLLDILCKHSFRLFHQYLSCQKPNWKQKMMKLEICLGHNHSQKLCRSPFFTEWFSLRLVCYVWVGTIDTLKRLSRSDCLRYDDTGGFHLSFNASYIRLKERFMDLAVCNWKPQHNISNILFYHTLTYYLKFQQATRLDKN